MSLQENEIKSDCPHCGKKLDRTSGDSKPQYGCISICIYCSNFSKFNHELKLEKVSDEEERHILSSTIKIADRYFTGQQIKDFTSRVSKKSDITFDN